MRKGTTNHMSLAIFLIFILLIGGVGAFLQSISVVVQGIGLGIYAIFTVFNHLPTSIFDLFALGITNSWSFTNIVWLDTLLVNIATLAPSVFTFLFSKLGVKLNSFISGILSLLVLVLVLELFSCVIFWIVIGIFVVCSIVVWIVLARNSKNI